MLRFPSLIVSLFRLIVYSYVYKTDLSKPYYLEKARVWPFWGLEGGVYTFRHSTTPGGKRRRTEEILEKTENGQNW